MFQIHESKQIRDSLGGTRPKGRAARTGARARQLVGLPFVLAAGLLVLASGVQADQQILDDLIVAGSECLGVDCNNGESFGFDTLRLKENNLRVRFVDTSTSASFPQNDWMIVINDSSNGGRNRFSIEDIDGNATPFTILAGAPEHALHISKQGLGLGTDAPARPLHVVVGDTPALRLDQSAAGGWPAQAWEVGGNELFFFVGDGNANTTPLRILPGSDDATLVISPGGDVTVLNRLIEGSSRLIKQGFEVVEPQEALEKLSRLEVTRWQYRSDGTGSRHIGPMAEDFYREFGLGKDARHIAPADVAGVAVLSVQALRHQVVDQAAEIERLRSEGEELSERLARLEARIAEASAN
jgi:hypothetical protein